MKTLQTLRLVVMLFLITTLSFNLSAQKAASCQNKAFLGVVMAGDASENQGVKVDDVVEKSAAAELGLQAGDLITNINNTKVANANELIAVMKKQAVGDKIGVVFVRDGQTQKAMATLQARPVSDYSHFGSNERFPAKDCWKQKSCDKSNNNKVLLGVFSETIDEAIIENNNLRKVKVGKGVFIEKIVSGSSAEDAGFQAGDVILKVGNQEVNSKEVLIASLAAYKVGDTETINYIRNGKKKKTSVTFKANKSNCNWKKDCKSKCKPSDCQKRVEKIIIQDGENLEGIENALKNFDGEIQVFKGNGEELNFNVDEMLEQLGENSEMLKEHLEDIELNIEDALQDFDGDIRIFKGDSDNFNLNDMLKNLDIDVQFFEEESDENGKKMKRIIVITGDENTGKVQITEPNEEDMEMMQNILRQQTATSQKTIAPSLESVKNINFYPNPSDGKFALKFNVPTAIATTIRVIDTKGQTVYEQKLPAFVGQYQQEIDISDSTTGLYLLQIVQGNEVMMRKILIQ